MNIRHDITSARAAAGAAMLLATASVAHAEVRFLDHRDKVIVLESPPQRVVSLFASGPIVYDAVDGSLDHIVGVNRQGLAMYQDSIYAQLVPGLLKLDMNVAGDHFAPNVEAILALKPDVVFQWTFDPKVIEPMERVGLKVVGWACCTNEDRRGYLSLSGYVSGRIDRAQAILRHQDASDKALRERFAAVKPADFVTMLVVDQIKDTIRVVANSSEDFTLSGARNLAADNTGEWWRTVDAEQLLVWNPSIIVIPAYATELTPADFYANATLANLDAVKHKRVYKFPQFNRSPDAPEIHLSDDWLARVANPQRFQGAASFRDTVKASYQLIYQTPVTDEQIRYILELEQNKDSAGYTDIFG